MAFKYDFMRRPSAVRDTDLLAGFQHLKARQSAARFRIAAQQAGIKIVRVGEDGFTAFEKAVNRLWEKTRGPKAVRW